MDLIFEFYYSRRAMKIVLDKKNFKISKIIQVKNQNANIKKKNFGLFKFFL